MHVVDMREINLERLDDQQVYLTCSQLWRVPMLLLLEKKVF